MAIQLVRKRLLLVLVLQVISIQGIFSFLRPANDHEKMTTCSWTKVLSTVIDGVNFTSAFPMNNTRCIPENSTEFQPRFLHYYSQDDPDLYQEFGFVSREMEANGLGTVGQITNFTAINVDRIHRQAKTVFLIHGFHSNAQRPWIKRIAELFKRFPQKYNVFAVNWTRAAAEPLTSTTGYLKSSANTRLIAYYTQKFIKTYLMNELEITANNIHIIGHSLGAHLGGLIGQYFKSTDFYNTSETSELYRITGLDPAGDKYVTDERDRIVDEAARLSRDDAQLVDIIHTSIYPSGTTRIWGDMDFFVNTGRRQIQQPGCKASNSLWEFDDLACDHAKSQVYFIESMVAYLNESTVPAETQMASTETDGYNLINNGGCSFRALKCDTDCRDMFDGHCFDRRMRCSRSCNLETGAGCQKMGFDVDPKITGLMVVATQEEEPWCTDVKKTETIQNNSLPLEGWLLNDRADGGRKSTVDFDDGTFGRPIQDDNVSPDDRTTTGRSSVSASSSLQPNHSMPKYGYLIISIIIIVFIFITAGAVLFYIRCFGPVARRRRHFKTKNQSKAFTRVHPSQAYLLSNCSSTSLRNSDTSSALRSCLEVGHGPEEKEMTAVVKDKSQLEKNSHNDRDHHGHHGHHIGRLSCLSPVRTSECPLLNNELRAGFGDGKMAKDNDNKGRFDEFPSVKFSVECEDDDDDADEGLGSYSDLKINS